MPEKGDGIVKDKSAEKKGKLMFLSQSFLF